jgi:hypothetical protein
VWISSSENDVSADVIEFASLAIEVGDEDGAGGRGFEGVVCPYRLVRAGVALGLVSQGGLMCVRKC